MTPVDDLSGRWRIRPSDTDLAKQFLDPGLDDTDWIDADVPHHWRAVPELATADGPILYRRHFALDPPSAPGERRILELDGLFYYGDVWLDGNYLGATEGYFAPCAFDVTEHLARDGDHILAVEVASPAQRDRTAKRSITGDFGHSALLDPDSNPGGIWRPVRVARTGPLRIARLRVVCVEASTERGRLRVDLSIDAASESLTGARLRVEVDGPTGDALAAHEQALTLAAGENRIRTHVDVEGAPRWWPRRLGDQPRCDVRVILETGDGALSDGRTLRTAFREVKGRAFRFSVNGEPLYLMGANYGPARQLLGDATDELLRADVQRALDANLDFLRVHAHVSLPALYDAADAAGLLLWQDFPLQWAYARSVRKQAVRQARAMVDLLGHHPSVFAWCAHNEPMAVAEPGEPETPGHRAKRIATMVLPTWNKDVLDRSVARAIGRADGTRPLVSHSGVVPGIGQTGTDTHAHFGWDHGDMTALASTFRLVPRFARFVGEFGAQAVPATVEWMHPERWPDLDWDALARHHSLDRAAFARYVPPADAKTFEEWRDATQAYQAALIQLQVEDLRRVKYAPGGGFAYFCFADAHPAVSWSVLDHERVAKRGLGALRDACRPVLPMIEPRAGIVHVVSELRRPLDGAVIEVWADERVHRFTGDVPADGICFVGFVGLGGAVDVEVALEHPAVGRVVNRYPLLVLEACRGMRH
jgi:beta-mannosidase